MKHGFLKLTVLILLLLLPHSALAGTSVDYNDANCQGAWLFTEGSGETVADSSQNSNVGAWKGSGEPAWASMAGTNAPSYATYMVDFDGSDDYIDDTTPASLPINDTDDFSFGLWVNPDALANGMNMFGFGHNADNLGKSRSLIRYNNKIYFWGSGRDVQFDTDLTQSVWQHVYITEDNTAGNMIMYKDGVANSKTSPTLATCDSEELAFGKKVGATAWQSFFNGKESEAAIFDRALDSTEINDIMDNGLEGGAAPGVAHSQVIMIF